METGGCGIPGGPRAECGHGQRNPPTYPQFFPGQRRALCRGYPQAG